MNRSFRQSALRPTTAPTRGILICALSLWLAMFATIVDASTTSDGVNIVTFVGPANLQDTRGEYETKLLALALDKTTATHGKITLIPAPLGITNSRARENMRKNTHPNFVRSFAYRSEFADDPDFAHIAFPIYRGLLGYRICFVSEKAMALTAQVKTLEQLKKFTHGQGIGWTDTEILRSAGFKVLEVTHYESLFKMISINRVDLFCRGISEYLSEYEKFKEAYNLNVVKNFAIYYAFPLYFYSNKKNKAILQRIELGLKMAYEDGSFMQLWQQSFSESIRKADLSNRTIFRIENPTTQDLDPSYLRYFFIAPPSVRARTN